MKMIGMLAGPREAVVTATVVLTVAAGGVGLGTASASAGVSAARGPVAFAVVAKGVTPIRTAPTARAG